MSKCFPLTVPFVGSPYQYIEELQWRAFQILENRAYKCITSTDRNVREVARKLIGKSFLEFKDNVYREFGKTHQTEDLINTRIRYFFSMILLEKIESILLNSFSKYGSGLEL